MIFLEREKVPIHQHILISQREAARGINCGKLKLRYCEDCTFIFNDCFDSSKLEYGDSYDNSQFHSSYFNTYVDSLVDYLIEKKNVRNCNIVEVGCGDGTFINKLIKKDKKNIGVGFDPSYKTNAIINNSRLSFIKEYYGPKFKNIRADVVISRHVIEHVPNPLEMLISMREALLNSQYARVFLETPCVEWILENKVVWDFFYEHCSYFSTASLQHALQTAGFAVDEIRHTFNGQYLWAEAHLNQKQIWNVDKPQGYTELVKSFSATEAQIVKCFSQKLENLRSKHKIAIWGAGAKGVTLANLVDPGCSLIDCFIDVNPHKQNLYVPGTGHPIISWKELQNKGITAAIIMNPNYRHEIECILQEAGFVVELIEFDVSKINVKS
ncbi:class I SAM-dependent methyltransferase [Lucifera butyrica]|nr:class I SAM-dependent methyltransferase [Lucifera butyrica]